MCSLELFLLSAQPDAEHHRPPPIWPAISAPSPVHDSVEYPQAKDSRMTAHNIDVQLDAPLGWEPYTENNPFMRQIGPLWQRIVDHQFEYAFRVDHIHCNLLDVIHGGMISAFADHALGHVAWHVNGNQPIVTVHLDVNFIAAARLGDFVECRTEVVRKTRSLCFMRGSIMVDSRCIATASGVWKIIGA
jgi:uncharacterized protein (TIGR00369 family)